MAGRDLAGDFFGRPGDVDAAGAGQGGEGADGGVGGVLVVGDDAEGVSLRDGSVDEAVGQDAGIAQRGARLRRRREALQAETAADGQRDEVGRRLLRERPDHAGAPDGGHVGAALAQGHLEHRPGAHELGLRHRGPDDPPARQALDQRRRHLVAEVELGGEAPAPPPHADGVVGTAGGRRAGARALRRAGAGRPRDADRGGRPRAGPAGGALGHDRRRALPERDVADDGGQELPLRQRERHRGRARGERHREPGGDVLVVDAGPREPLAALGLLEVGVHADGRRARSDVQDGLGPAVGVRAQRREPRRPHRVVGAVAVDREVAGPVGPEQHGLRALEGDGVRVHGAVAFRAELHRRAGRGPPEGGDPQVPQPGGRQRADLRLDREPHGVRGP
ncbi:hypothetical protein ISCU110981_12960 [Isoptericola cucumis]